MVKVSRYILYGISIIGLFFVSSYQCNAQILSRFRLGVDFGAVLPKGSPNVVVGTDLKYQFSKRISGGLRIEGAAIAKDVKNGNGEVETGDQRLNLALLSTVNYYFSQHLGVYPFVELGIGRYEIAEISANVSQNYMPITFEDEFGVMCKVGFEHEKVCISIGYHLIPNQNQVINGIDQEIKADYLTFSVGYFVGGKRENYE